MQIVETAPYYDALKPLTERKIDIRAEINVLRIEISKLGYAVIWKKVNTPVDEPPSHLGLKLIDTGELSSGFRDEENLQRILIYDPNKVTVRTDYANTLKQKENIQGQRTSEGAFVLEPHTIDRVVSIYKLQTP